MPAQSTSETVPRADKYNYGLEIRYTLRAFTQALAEIARTEEVTASEFRLLRTLGQDEGTTQAELADLAGMDRPYVSVLVKRLLREGFLLQRTNRQDRRRTDIVLSAAGRRVYQRIAHQLDEVNRRAGSGIPAAELDVLISVLARMRENLDGARERTLTT